jgi:AraC-like DNA-binding protein
MLGGLESVCERDGISVANILAAGGVELTTVRSPSERILRSQAAAVANALSAVSPDPHAAFRLGVCAPVEKSPEFVRFLTSAPNLNSLVGPINAALGGICGGLISLSLGSAFARFGFGFPSWNIALEEPLREAAAGAVISLLRLRFGPAWKPIRVLVGHRRPMPKLVKYDGIQIVLGAPDNAVIMSVADAVAKPRPDRPKSSSKKGPSAQPTDQNDFASVDQIQRVIYGRLSLALDTALDDVAKVFGLSSRSLKRHLAAERQTFSSIVEEIKITEAKRLLSETDFPITEIADLLRYRHLPSFTRAFKRSTGSPPSEFRMATEINQES